MMFIGWFLKSAADDAERQVSLRELVRGVTAAQLMTLDCPRVGRDWTIERVIRGEVLGAGRRSFFVMDDGRLEGLLTLHELKTVPHARWSDVTVGEVAKRADGLSAIRPEEDVLVALQKMDEADVAQLPVIADDKLVGVIGREHILRYFRTRMELGV
jgi:CBS domain-containing protein